MDNIVVREGTKSDCKEIRRLIQDLVDSENMPQGPRIGHETLEKDGFEHNPPLFFCYVAEEPNSTEKKLIGYALYYYTYSTWIGKKMYLEDLYVSEKFRRLHVGSKIFKVVAKKAVEEDCAYLEFSILARNPARQFYEKFGAVNVTETEQWNVYRLKDKAFHKAAQL